MILCVFMPDVQIETLPATLRMIVRNVTCLRWPRDPRAQKVFWLLLQNGLQEGSADVRPCAVL